MIFSDIVSYKVLALELSEDVSDFRGWSERVRPRYGYLPTVSELSSPCPTHRDVYLTRVEGLKAEGAILENGRLVHEAFLTPFRLAMKGILDVRKYANVKHALMRRMSREVRQIASRIYDYASAMALQWLVLGKPLPIAVEPNVRASLIGLSDTVRPDLVVGIVPYEFASNRRQNKELAVVAYAMALEATALTPVNYGVFVYPHHNGLRYRVIPASEELRRRVLDVRDKIARVVYYEEDPGPANRARCPRTCPFLGVCHDRV